MLHPRPVILLVATLLVLASGQTFQYSRGWTNGKRSTPLESAGQFISPRLLPGMEKSSEKLLLQHILRSSCDQRIANFLANHSPGKDLLYQLIAELDGNDLGPAVRGLPPLDSDGGAGAGLLDEMRFKRENGVPQGHQRSGPV